MTGLSAYTRHIIGHDDRIEGLKKAIGQDRFAHANLFCGPEGVGKRTLAKALAAYFLRDTASHVDRVNQGIHPDYLYVDTAWGVDNATATIKVEAVRQLEERLVVGPFESARIVVVIDPADAMTESAANALLKTLEEPPSGTIFFLISSAPYRLPATIRSRCRVFDFGALDDAAVITLIRRHLPDMDPEPGLVALCDGSVGRALKLFASENLAGFPELAENVLQLAFAGTLPELFDAAEELAALEREQLELFLMVFSRRIRDRFLADPEPPPRPAPMPAWLKAVESARMDVVMNVNKRIVMENLLWKLRRI